MGLKLETPPKGLEGDALHAWYESAADSAAKDEYETKLGSQRDKRRAAEAKAEALQDELDELKEKVPGKGAVTLSAEEAERWEKLKDIDPEKLAAEKAEAERVIRLRQLEEQAAIEGLNPSTFADFALLRNMQTEVDTITEEVDGEQVEKQRVVVVTQQDGKEVRTPVMSFLQAQHAGWLPSLVASGSETPTPPAGGGTPPLRRLPTDPPPDENPQKALLRRRQEEAKQRTNAFAMRTEQ